MFTSVGTDGWHRWLNHSIKRSLPHIHTQAFAPVWKRWVPCNGDRHMCAPRGLVHISTCAPLHSLSILLVNSCRSRHIYALDKRRVIWDKRYPTWDKHPPERARTDIPYMQRR